MRKNSVKNTRINSEVQKVLAETIRGRNKGSQDCPPHLSGGGGGISGFEDM